MGSILGGGAPEPQQPDTSYLDAQREQADADRAKLERENAAKRRNVKARRSGRSSLLFADARGVTPETANAAGLKSTLGA